MPSGQLPELFKMLMDQFGTDSMYSSPTPLYAANIASQYGDASTVNSIGKALSDPALKAYASLAQSGFSPQLQLLKSRLMKPGAIDLARQQQEALQKRQRMQQILDNLRSSGFDATQQ